MIQYVIDNFIYTIQDFAVAAGQGNPIQNIWFLFVHGGWVFFLLALLVGLFGIYLNYIRTKFVKRIKWTVLAIDVPQENLQSIKAVEHIFSAMWPLYESRDLKDKYIDGKFQLAYSLEIVSIGGYTQYLIRVPSTHKDLVEASIYAQYPKAEIFEVEDYTQRYKDLTFPNDEYDIWGSEFKLKKPSPYPIKTYPYFEHTLTQTFADPIAALLEVFNGINKGEELWMQLVITPINDDWKQEGYKIINKIIGVQQSSKKGFLSVVLSPFYHLATLIEELFIYGIGYEPGRVNSAKLNEQNMPPNRMLYLTPEEKNIIDGITNKISKIGYQTKFRAIYLGRKGKLNKAKGVASFIGALQQFSTLDLNAFVPAMKTFTKANYFFVDRRVASKQRKILNNFIKRSQSAGWGKGFVLNIEELASIFHFPSPEIMRESVKSVSAIKEAPPINLPDVFSEETYTEKTQGGDNNFEQKPGGSSSHIKQTEVKPVKIEPPDNLPF